MVFRTQSLVVLATLLAASSLTLGYPALSEGGGWSHFLEQQLDMNDPNSHGVGGLLSETQKKQLSDLDADLSSLEDQVAQAINANQLTPAQAADLRDQIGKIEFRQTDILTKGTLDYQDAEGLLVDEQRIKATLKAALAGQSKVSSADYYDSKDAFAFRDHLVRKLYFYRLNGALSAEEYDELRSHVEHAGQKLEKEGQSGAHDAKLLKRMRELEGQINTLIGGANTSPQPVEKVNVDNATFGNPASSQNSAGTNTPLNQAVGATSDTQTGFGNSSITNPAANPAANPATNAMTDSAVNQVTKTRVDLLTMPVTDPTRELPNTPLNTLPANTPHPNVSGPLSAPDLPNNLNLNLNQAQ